jgi:predicted transposase/invertase (TIGR01784 family)
MIGRGKKKREINLLPLKSDIIFKAIFGDKRNKHILTAFLKTVLEMPEDEFESIELIDPHIEREFPDDKLCILDVRVETKRKKLIDIEIQLYDVPFMQERITFYTCGNLTTQISSGDTYINIKKAVTIVILDYNILPDKARYHHVFRLYDPINGAMLTDILEIHTLELRKLPELPANPADRKEEELLYWLKLIRTEMKEEADMLATKTPEIGETVARMKKLSSDERTRLIYESREKATRDHMARMSAARAEGERQASVTIAKNLLVRGVSPDIISESSGLSLEEING